MLVGGKLLKTQIRGEYSYTIQFIACFYLLVTAATSI